MRVIVVVAILVILAVGIEAVGTGRGGNQKTAKTTKKKNLCDAKDVEDAVAQIVGTTKDWRAAKEKTTEWTKSPTSNLAASFGITLGEKKQTLFWDVKAKVWRYGPGSFDPANGASRENQKCPFSKVVAKPGPAVDMCKINPSLCAGSQGAFCFKEEHKKFCCANGGCKGPAAAAVRGLSRSKMPQAQDSPTVESSKWFQYHRTLARDFACPEERVNLNDLTPIQDEINLGKSLVIACGIKSGDRPKFIVTSDNYIYDGHHRWSSYKAANQYLGTKIETITVHKCNKEAAWMVGEAHKLMKPEAKNGGSKKPEAIKFEGLIEIRALYGPRVHENEDDARETYVLHTMDRMDKAGFVPRDGVESLREFWETNVRMHAGW